jgi:hypothetical protein
MQGPRGERNIYRNDKNPKNRSVYLQGRQREADEGENSDKFLSATELKSTAKSI